MQTLIPVLAATIIQFIVGAIWYSALFGKLWGKIHGFDKLTKETQQKMMSEMGPFYGVQLVVTIVTSYALYFFLREVPRGMPYPTSLLLWIGFMVPTQVSAVIFGGTPKKWVLTKVLVMAGAALACILSATFIISFF